MNGRGDQACQMCGQPRPADASYREQLIPDERPPVGTFSYSSSSTSSSSGRGGFAMSGGPDNATRARINELHAAALGGLAGSAIAMLNGSSVTRGAFTGASAGFVGSSILNEFDALSSHLEQLREHMESRGGDASAGGGIGGDFEELLQRFGNGAPQQSTSAQTVAALPTRRIASTTSLPADGRSCCICLAEFEIGDDVKTLPCFHVYHDPCISRWLQQSTQCPTCKSNVGNVNT